MFIRLFIIICVYFGLVGQLSAQYESKELYIKVNPLTESVEARLDLIANFWKIYAFERTFKLNNPKLIYTYTISFNDSLAAMEFLKRYQEIPWISYAERVPILKTSFTPNDVHPNQWALARVNAENAWDESQGDTNVTIAIVDDGVLLSHEDLAPVIWINPGEIPNNNIDDDGNGYVDDIHGFDVADNDSDPNPPSGAAAANFSHGTHCAGIAAARTNNGRGIASLAFNCRIIAVKCSRLSSPGRIFNGLGGIEYAITVGANVISMSFGGYGSSVIWQDLIDVGHDLDIVFVAAAGNDNTVVPAYPANYNHVISVGSTTSNDEKSGFSNYGAGTDIMAPGSNIWSCGARNQTDYMNMSGTSMACPLVSGLAGLMISKRPTLKPNEIEQCIKSTGLNIDNLHPAGMAGNFGGGRVDAEAAMKCVKLVNADFSSDMIHVCPGGSVQYEDKSFPLADSWYWEFQGGNPLNSSQQNPIVSYATSGIYSVKLKVTKGNESDSIIRSQYITVATPSAQISGNYQIPSGFSVNLRVDLTGTPPWRVKLKYGGFTQWINNISTTPYYFSVTPGDTGTYELDSAFDANCMANVSGRARIRFSTPPNCASGGRYEKLFRMNGNQRSHSIVSCEKNGGFLWTGITNNFGAGSDDVMLVKFDDTGKVEWATTVGSNALEQGFSAKAIETHDSGFAVISCTRGFGAGGDDAYLVKLTKNGSVQWSRRYGGSQLEYGRALAQTPDKGFVIGGTAASLPRSGLQDAMIIKTDSNGAIQWERKVGFAGGTTMHITSIHVLPSGNILGFGAGDIGITPYVGYMIRLSPTGTVLQQLRISTTEFDALVGGTQLLDGSFAYVGSVAPTTTNLTWQYLVMRLDTAGVVDWVYKLSRPTGVSRLTGIAATRDSGFVVSGATTAFSSIADLAMVKFSRNGGIIWSRRYGGTGEEYQDYWGNNLAEAIDGGIVITASTNSFSSTTNNNLLFLKLDACGVGLNCHEQNISFNLSQPTVTRAILTGAINTGTTSTSVTSTAFILSDTVRNNLSVVCTNPDPDSSVVIPGCYIKADFAIEPSCAGSPTRFVSTTTDTIGSQTVYHQWILSTGDTIVGSSVIQKIFPQPGQYSITYISGNNNQPACFDTITKPLSVFNQFNLDLYNGDTLCEGDSAFPIINHLVCQTGRVRYNWSPASWFTSTTMRQPKFATNSSGWIFLEVNDSLGNRSFDSAFIQVNQSCCQSYAKWELDNPVICAGSSVQFNNRSVAKSGASYEWTFQGTSISTFNGVTPPILTFVNEGNYSIKLVINDVCGRDSFEAIVSVLALPDANELSDTILCSPDTLRIQSTPLSQYGYFWIPGLNVSDSLISDPSIYVDTTRTYVRRVESYWSGCLNYDTIVIKVSQIDKFKQGLDTNICQNDTLLLNYGNSSGVQIDWLDGFIGVTRSISASGTYVAKLSESICEFFDTTIVAVNSGGITINGPNEICGTDSAVYLLSGSKGIVEWFDGSSDTIMVYKGSRGWISAKVLDGYCAFRDSLFINRIDSLPFISVGVGELCAGDSIMLSVDQNLSGVFRWSNGAFGRSIWIKSGGNFSVERIVSGCVLTQIIDVPISDSIPQISGPSSICINGSATLQVDPNLSGIIRWNTGQIGSQITVNSPGLYIVERRSNNCVLLDSMFVSLIDSIPFISGPSRFCENSQAQLSISPLLSGTLLWSTGETTKSILVNQPGWYSVVRSKDNCTLLDSFLIEMDFAPSRYDLGNDTILCLGESLDYLVTGLADSFVWWDGTADSVKMINASGTYWISVLNPCGRVTDTVNVEVENCCTVYFPSAFTINGDGLNDEFKPNPCIVSDYRIIIYDRWGEIVFISTDITKGWDGTYRGENAMEGAYNFTANFVDGNGNRKTSNGVVMLLRPKR